MPLPKPKTKPTAPPKRKGGAPRKAPGGLNKVLFIRTDETLLASIDAYAAEQRKERPGRGCSRADVARELLLAKLEDLRLAAAFT